MWFARGEQSISSRNGLGATHALRNRGVYYSTFSDCLQMAKPLWPGMQFIKQDRLDIAAQAHFVSGSGGA